MGCGHPWETSTCLLTFDPLHKGLVFNATQHYNKHNSFLVIGLHFKITFILQGRAEILKLLIKDRRKIDPNEFHKDGFAPLHRACWGQESRHTDTARVFVELGGVPWNVKSKKGTICRDITNNPATRNLMIEYQNKNKEL